MVLSDIDKRMKQIEARKKADQVIQAIEVGQDSEWIRNALRVQYENEDIEWIKNNEKNLEMIIRIQLTEALKKAKVIETPTAIFHPKEEN